MKDLFDDEKLPLSRKKKTIDMVTRLYVSIIKYDQEISLKEINILYSLLINLFRYVDVSWEIYVRRIIEHEFEISEVIDYLNIHLNSLDKTRVVLSLIIMAKTDVDFDLTDITNILDICKSFDLETEGFVKLIDNLEFQSSELVFVSYGQNISSVYSSLFSDFIVFGRESTSNVRYRNTKISGLEVFLMAIDNYLFIGSGTNTTAIIDDQKLRSNSICLFKPESLLRIGTSEYDIETLWKIYNAQSIEDDIAFSKSDYDFVIHNSANKYNITVNSGSVYLNGKQLLHNRLYNLFHDDTLQIRGYSPFQLIDVIRERSRIGVYSALPKELYIDHENDYYMISKTETSRSIAMIEVKDSEYYIYPPKRGWEIYINQKKLLQIEPLLINSDIITINKHNFRINNYHDLIEIPFELEQLSIMDIKHYFEDGQLALDSISFDARKGELIGIMGQSGSGKSTLLKTISTEIMPTYGELQIDGKSIYSNINYYTQYFGYVPQDDLLYPFLSVYENLWYRGRLRMPNLSRTYLNQKIYNILQQVNLLHRKDTQVGDSKKKLLSGGERKRLNIALELLFEPTVIICDEPTSGLSYNDTEQIIDILNNLTAQGKIVIITIHQPSSSIFKKFSKVMLMDMSGKQVYYGDPISCFDYFDYELSQLSYRSDEIERKKLATTSDYMYEVILYPEYNDKNEPVYEQVSKMLQVKRKFPPEYWRDKYKRKMLFEIIQHERTSPRYGVINPKRKRQRKLDLKSHVNSFFTFIHRSLTMKLRNKTNNLITFIEAPILAFIISFILRLAPVGEKYSYSTNQNIGIFIFVSIIAFVFMGLSNSIEEIFDERKMVLREKLMNLKISYYLISKFVSLTAFSVIQVLLYVSISSLILGIKGVFGISFMYLLLAAMIGYSIGLLTSSFIKDNKAIINLLPLILIPQIIFGGAVIEFERMNRSMIIRKDHPMPEIVQFIPSRWLFEGLTTAYAKNNAFYRKLNTIEKKKLTYIDRLKDNEITSSEYNELLRSINQSKADVARKWDISIVGNDFLNTTVSLMDGKFANTERNVFLSSYKRFNGVVTRTWKYCSVILLLFVLVLNMITMIKIKYFYKE